MKENQPKICVIDDTKYIRGALAILLSKCNYEVIVAENGEEALEKLEKTPVDLIMLDIIMPGIDGFETCKRLKQLESTKETPIIFMTSLNDVVDKVKGLSLGAVDYITKPLDPPEVMARLKVHLKLRFLNKQLQEKNELLKQEIQVRAKIEQALWETQRTLSTLMSNLPGIAYRRQNNQKWTMDFISVGCHKLTGYSPKAFTTRQVSYGELIPSDDREKIWQTIQTQLEQKLPYQIVYRLFTKESQLKWIWEQGREVVKENKTAILEGFITDITDQKVAESALERELEKTLLLKEITEEIRSSLDIKQIFATAAKKNW